MSAVPTCTVSQLNSRIKSCLEGEAGLRNVCVVGEVSDFKRYGSGYLYFSLKDPSAVIRGIMFPRYASMQSFFPENGMKVLVVGSVSFYEPRGDAQLAAKIIQPAGEGERSLAFEQLRAKLSAEGLFDEAKKRPLPRYPQRIGVVSSPIGAAIKDICQVAGKRWPLAEIVLSPAPVQGPEAPAKLVQALERLNQRADCDVILLSRGGGSSEDLWIFNDEALVRAVRASRIPVVTGIGHEIDVCLCDFAADFHAPTPSAAAETVTPDGDEEIRRLSSLREDLRDAMGRRLTLLRGELFRLREGTVLSSPSLLLGERRERVSLARGCCQAAMKEILSRRRGKLAFAAGRLDAMSPLKVLSRGYAVVQRADGSAARDAGELQAGEQVTLRLAKGQKMARILGEDE